MKRLVLKIAAVVLLISTCDFAYSQTTTKKKAGAKKGTAKAKGTVKKGAKGNNTSNPYDTNPYGASTANPYGGATASADTTKQPKEKQKKYFQMPATGGGLFDTVKPSLRNDNATVSDYIKDKTPLAYTYMRDDDAVYKQRIWREIDIREKINQPFGYAANYDDGNQRFISIIFSAIKNKEVIVFDATDDRFTTPLTFEEALKAFGGRTDTVERIDIDGNRTGEFEIRSRPIMPDSIYKFRLKEDVVFDKQRSMLDTRIIGIAPMMKQYASDGSAITPDAVPLFWIYFPDLRPTLAKHEVYNPKNLGARMTWDDLFQERMFNSYIIKTTLNNYRDMKLREYINDPLFRLLEGDKIKEKIFNYEQDLWSY